MCTYLGAGAEIDPRDVDADRIAGAAVTYLEGYLWDEPGGEGRDPARGVARARRRPQGRAHALRPVLRRAPPRRVPRRWSQSDIDILFANEDEITMLYEVDDFDDAARRIGDALRDRRAHARRAGLGRRERRASGT